jgi:hypothetical protein
MRIPPPDDPYARVHSSCDPPGNTAFDRSGYAMGFFAIEDLNAGSSSISPRTDNSQQPRTRSPTYLGIARNLSRRPLHYPF